MKYPTRPFLFDCFSPDCGAALITAVAEAMAEGLDADQIGVLGNFVSAVGDTLAYISAQIQRNEQTCPKKRAYNTDNEKTDGNKTEGGKDNSGGDKISAQKSRQKDIKGTAKK
jgi:hypothetical protein